MDDPDEDWEIDDQNTCQYLEGGGGCECNVRWILEKGMDLGKKAVITGFVVSSAPVVLPSILVVSAVGFACSVPFGLVFTSYACTQKLMSTLLPMATTSQVLEYDQMCDYEEKVEGKGEGKDLFESHVYMEEEKEQMDYGRAGVEESIELVKNENEVPREDDDSKDMRRDDLLFDDKADEVERRGEGSDRIEHSVYMAEDEKEKMDDLRPGIEESVDSVKNKNESPRGDDDSKHSRRGDQIFGREDEEVEGRGDEKDLIESRIHMEEGKEQLGDLKVGEESIESVKNVNEVAQVEDSKDIRRNDRMIDAEAEEMEGRRESRFYMEEEGKEQTGGLVEGLEESTELVENEYELPQEEDEFKDIMRDDELIMHSENASSEEEGYEEDDDAPLAYNNESSEEKVARPDKGTEEAIEQEIKSEELIPGEDTLEPFEWNDSREEEKGQMDGLRASAEDSTRLVKNENEVPEEEDRKDTRRDDEPRMTTENNSMKESHEEDDIPIVYNNEGSEEKVLRADKGHEEDVNQKRKSKELRPEEDAPKITSREEEKEQMGGLRASAVDRIKLVKNENEAPKEEEDSKNTRRDDHLRMTTKDISLDESHEEDHAPIVYNNEFSKEIIPQADVGQEGTINQERKSEELMSGEDSLKPSVWIDYREKEKEQMDDLRKGVEERIELVKRGNDVPLEDDNSKDSRRDDEPRMTSENISPNEGHEEDNIQAAYNNNSLEEMVAREDMGREDSIDQERKCKELFLKEDELKPLEWTNSREGEKEKMDAKDENVVPQEEEFSKDNRRDDEPRMITKNISLKEGHEEGGEPIVYKNKSSTEMVDPEDMGQAECIGQERESKELFPKEEALENSDWTYSTEMKGGWVVAELKIEGEEEIGNDKSINENIVGNNVRPGVLGEFSECQTKVNNDEEDIKRGSVGLLEKIRDEGNADDATKQTKNKNKKKPTREESAEMSLPEVKDQDVISQTLTVANGVTESQQTGPETRKKLDDSDEVGMPQLPVGGAASVDDSIPAQDNITKQNPLRESDKTSGIGNADPMVIENVDVIQISVTASKPKAIDAESSEAVLTTEKEAVEEEKIWEQIDALRKIVGYKATTYRSSIEEVKALYTFTGVELPSSFGNPPDLAELSNKLRFLMSILGVK